MIGEHIYTSIRVAIVNEYITLHDYSRMYNFKSFKKEFAFVDQLPNNEDSGQWYTLCIHSYR